MSERWREAVVGIVYPESDGAPMGETELHVEELMALRQALMERYHDDPDTYVGADMFVYWREGDPRAVFCPDVFFVRGVPKRVRRTYKIWEEGEPPTFVLELSSESTWLEDVGNKKALCARLGVTEYFLCDPEPAVLVPPLQGYRLAGGEYRPIVPAADGSVASEVLGLDLYLDEARRLHVRDRITGAILLRNHELHVARRAAEHARHEAEHAQREAERAQREAEARAARAEAELAALRAELAAARGRE